MMFHVLIFSLSYTIVVPKREDMAVQKKKKKEREDMELSLEKQQLMKF